MNKLPDTALGFLGFCRRSNRIVIGTDATLSAVRGKKTVCLVIIASDASDRTVKQITDKCATYTVPVCRATVTGGELARFLGKEGQVMVVGATDKGLASQMIKQSLPEP